MNVDGDRTSRIEARRSDARSRAEQAVAALGAGGIAAQAIGSLERPDFREDSDVDLLVGCGSEDHRKVYAACHDAFKDMPFDIVFEWDLGPDLAATMVLEARHAEPFASIGRRIEAIRHGMVEVERVRNEVARWLVDADRDEREARMWAGIASDRTDGLIRRLAKLLRRVILDAGGTLALDPVPAAIFEAAAAAMPDAERILGQEATAALARSWPDPWDPSARNRGPGEALVDIEAAMAVAEIVMVDVDAFVEKRLDVHLKTPGIR